MWTSRAIWRNPLLSNRRFTSPSLEAERAKLRHHQIHGDVPGTNLQRTNPLAFMRDTDQARPMPAASLEWYEGSVVIPAPHAKAMHRGIKSDQGHQYGINGPQFKGGAPPIGLRNSKPVEIEDVPWRKGDEPESAIPSRTQHGQADPFAPSQEMPKQQGQIYFAVIGEIECDCAAPLDQGIAGQSLGNADFILVSRFGRQRTSGLAEALSERGNGGKRTHIEKWRARLCRCRPRS